MPDHNLQLCDALTPRSIDDAILPVRLSKILHKVNQPSSLMHLTFYGTPGIGKTSLARILCEGYDIYEVNGSDAISDKRFLDVIRRFASTCSFFDTSKICLIDEADALSSGVQASLRGDIEKYSLNTRFILTVNDLRKISPAIQSRCTPICFNVTSSDFEELAPQLFERYERMLDELGYSINKDRLHQIIRMHFPDYRSIAKHVQLELD